MLVAAVATAACDKKKNEGAEGKEQAKEEKAKKGMENPENDAKIVEQVKKVLECEWKKYGFSRKCEAFKAFKKSEAFKGGKGDKTLINLLEDENEKVRWLAARGLKYHGKAYETDPKMAASVMTAMEKEKSEMVATMLAGTITDIRLKQTNLVDRFLKLAKGHDNKEVRERLIRSVLFRNRESKEIYELVKKMAKEAKDDDIRRAAVRAFWIGTPRDKTAEVCKLWLDIGQTDKNDKVAAISLRLAAQNPNSKCKDQYKTILDIVEKKAKAGKVDTSDLAYALKYVHGQKESTEAQKKRAVEIAKTLLDNKDNKGMARGAALRFLGKAVPEGEKLANKYKDDKEFFVKNAAKRILKKGEKGKKGKGKKGGK